MAKRFNGRFFPPGHDAPSDDPEKDFPIAETVYDHSGTPRHFTIHFHHVGLGYSLRAQEDVEDGYEFSAFDSTSPYLALGELRQKMHRALATRHLVPTKHDGELDMLHDRVAGHIGYSASTDSSVFVVDGIPLTLDDIGRLAKMHEGWQFSLRFADPSEESP